MSDVLSLEATSAVFAHAKSPEDIFGLIGGATPDDQKHALNTLYRRLAMVLHPDKHAGSAYADLASRLFSELNVWKSEADAKIDVGTYGNGKPHEPPPAPVTIHPQVIKTGKRQYTVTSLFAQGDLADLYSCTYAEDGKDHHVIFKIAQSAADNDLLENEGKVLTAVYPPKQPEEKFFRLLPKLYDTFVLRSGGVNRRVNVLQQAEGHVSLAEVFKAYPKGVDFRDMVWMFKRCLMGLGFVHQKGVVHGAVLPTHLLVHPTDHGAKIVDWCYSVPGDATRDASKRGAIKAISKAYRGFYPPEVLAKKPATAQTDVFMLAKCMVQLLGGDVATNQMPDSVPKPLRAFFGGCLLENQARRPDDAWKLHEELDELLQRLVGKPRYRALVMPGRP